MSQFVLDASVALTWCIEGQSTDYTLGALDALQEDGALVPVLWALEIANVLASQERRGSLTAAASSEFVTLALQLPIEVDATPPLHVFAHMLPLAREHRLSAYDAAYLELARRRRVPLATIDGELSRAARRAKVRLFEP